MVRTYPSINGMFRLPVVDGVPYIYGKVPAKKLPELFLLFYGNFNDSVKHHMWFSIMVVTIAVLLIICKMYFAYIGWKSPFHPLYSECKPIAGERPANVNVIVIQSIQRWTVHSVGYTILSLTIRVCLHSFSRCCLPNLQNHAKFRASNSRSFKVIDLVRGHRTW